MNDHEREPERRKQKALERLGTCHPVCVLCGEDDWCCLELHHIAGQRFDTTLAVICRNCHRKLSDSQKDHPKQRAIPPDPLEQIGHFLLGLADLFALLVEKLRDFGEALVEQVAVKSVTPKVSR